MAAHLRGGKKPPKEVKQKRSKVSGAKPPKRIDNVPFSKNKKPIYKYSYGIQNWYNSAKRECINTRKNLGFFAFKIRNISRYKKFLSSFILLFVLATEKPWHGNPPKRTSKLEGMSLVETLEISPR